MADFFKNFIIYYLSSRKNESIITTQFTKDQTPSAMSGEPINRTMREGMSSLKEMINKHIIIKSIERYIREYYFKLYKKKRKKICKNAILIL